MARFFTCILTFVALEGCADIGAQQAAEAVRQAETAQKLEASAQAAKWESEQVSVRAARAGQQAAILSEFERANVHRQLQMWEEQNAETRRLLAIQDYKKGKVSDREYQAAVEATEAQLNFSLELSKINSQRIDQYILP